MLKLLTILTNILVSNLLIMNSVTTQQYLQMIVTALRKSPDVLQTVSVPQVTEEALFVGFSLLKELGFKFITYVCSDVQDKQLSRLLLREYITILSSFLDSDKLYSDVTKQEVFQKFFLAKRKKMNMQMMLLCDCVKTSS